MKNFATIPARRRRPPAPPPLPPPGLILRPSSVNIPMDIRRRKRAARRDQRLKSPEQIHSGRGEIEECPSRAQDEWVISIEDELEQLSKSDDIGTWSKLSIYKIPKYLHQMHDKSYCPQTVSLGPYYHGKEHLKPMEYHKGRAVKKILMRRKRSFGMYIEAMRELEEKARACYEGVINMSSNDFTKMLVFDGCFVLEIWMGAFQGFEKMGYARNDPVFAMRESMHLIQRDMIMLENQLPLFVLDCLYALQFKHPRVVSVAHLAIHFFDSLILRDSFSTKSKMPQLLKILAIHVGKEVVHCLDAFRQSLFLPSLDSKSWCWRPSVVDKRTQQMAHCVTKLRAVGIKFKRRNTDYFWDIKFENGYLEIPKLYIHEGTKCLFLNLIAFEQSHINSSSDIISYMIFMDNLIDSAEDVSYLRKCDIIENWLETNSEVADLFNQIGRQGIVFNTDDNYLLNLSTKLKSSYDKRFKYFRVYAWAKALQEKYFDSPWGYISFFAACILLLLTFFQCYFAAKDYYNSSS